MIDNKDEDIKIQIYKLITKFTYNKKNMIYMLKNEDEAQDFINYAFVYYIDKLYPNYDTSKSALSTHVYTCLNHLYMYFFYQVKYHVDFSTARKMLNTKNKRVQEFYNLIYNTKALDTKTGSVQIVNESEGVDEEETYSSKDSSLADLTYEPFNYLYKTSKILTIDEIKETELGKIFNDAITRYFKKFKPESKYFEVRDRDIIWELTFRERKEITYQSIGDKWDGISRERVRQIITKFYNWLKNDKIMREELELDYIGK